MNSHLPTEPILLPILKLAECFEADKRMVGGALNHQLCSRANKVHIAFVQFFCFWTNADPAFTFGADDDAGTLDWLVPA